MQEAGLKNGPGADPKNGPLFYLRRPQACLTWKTSTPTESQSG